MLSPAVLSVAAQNSGYFLGGGGKLRYVEDAAEILTEMHADELGGRAEAISDKYGCEVRILTVGDMRDYGHTDIESLSYAVYGQYNLGYGPDKSCLLLVLSMYDRDYDLRAWGYATEAFTYYGIDTLLDRHVLPLLKDDKYYKAFSNYLAKAEEYLKMARDGAPFDRGNDPSAKMSALIMKLCVTILLPILISLSICMFWRFQMKTARVARTAFNYIPAGGFNLYRRDDIFLYRTVTRRKIESGSSSSGGGGGARAGSGGSSGRSGKF